MSIVNTAMTSAQFVSVGMSSQEVLLFMNGLFTGLVQDDNLEAVEICLQDLDGLEGMIAEAVYDFKTGSIQDIIEGAKLIGEVLAQAKGDEQNCKDMEQDWKRIEVWAKIFSDPSDLVQVIISQVVQNRTGLAADISKFKADEENKNFKDLGLTVADFLTLILGEVPNTPAPNALGRAVTGADVDKFINGVLIGLIGDDDLPAIQSCLKDADSVTDLANQAIAQFKLKSVDSIGAGITLLGKAMASVETDVSDCSAMKSTDWPRIQKWISVIQNQKKFKATVAWNVFKHQLAITSDITTIETDQEADKPQDMGQKVADVALLALGPIPKSSNTLELY